MEVDHLSAVQRDTQPALELGGGELGAVSSGQGGPKEDFSEGLVLYHPC